MKLGVALFQSSGGQLAYWHYYRCIDFIRDFMKADRMMCKPEISDYIGRVFSRFTCNNRHTAPCMTSSQVDHYTSHPKRHRCQIKVIK